MQTAVSRRAKRLPPPERRDQVLDAARGLILQFGYSGLTMNAVARAAKVTRPVVYDFFANREELLQALVLREEQRALATVVGSAPDLSRADEVDVDELVVDSLVAFVRAVQEEPETWRLVLLSPHGAPEVVQQHADAGRRAALAQLQYVAGQVLARRGGFAGLESELELLAEFVLQMCERFVRLMMSEPENYPAERIVAFGRQLVAALHAQDRSA